MIRTLSVTALLLMAACQQQKNPPANEAATQPSAPAAAAAVPSLAGEWRVTMISGDPNAAKLGMAATFGSGLAKLSSGCLQRAWTYTQNRNSVAFAASPGGSSNCGRSPSGDEETAYAALDAANIAIFAKDGKEASLSGTGGTLTLQRR